MMPGTATLIRIGIVLALLAAIGLVVRDWLTTRDALAAQRAAQAQIVQAFTDSTRSKDEALRRIQEQADLSHAAVAAAEQAAARAQRRAAQLSADMRRLAQDDASVAAYLGTRIPPALLDRLRNGAAAPGSDEDGDDRPPARSSAAPPDTDASAGR